MNKCILHQVPSDAKIKRDIKRIVFGKHLFCPHCGSHRLKKYGERYRCKKCRKPFSLTSATWLKGMKLNLQTFWLLLWCWTGKVPVDQARKTCGLSEITVRRWYDKFRKHLPQDKLFDLRLSGDVQMDEAYRGKKNKKYAVIGAKETNRNKNENEIQNKKVVFRVLAKNSVDRKDAVDFLARNVEPFSNLYSDGAAIYKGIGNWWPVNHEYERHNRFEFALTSEIEGLWGNLFTFIRRMYHHVTAEKFPRILGEFQMRFSYPELFESPEAYLESALVPLKRMVKKSVKIPEEIFTFKYPLFPLGLAENLSTVVPS